MVAPYTVYLVAGHEYSRKGIVWTTPCLHREKKLANRRKFRPLEVTTFDVSKGTIRIARYGVNTPPDKPDVEHVKLKEPITEKNYVKIDWQDDTYSYVFTSGFSDVTSIVDIYRYIEAATKNVPGRILEFSIFAHAYYDGPILANTCPHHNVVNVNGRNTLLARSQADFNVRQKADLDPRMIDFNSMTQDRQDLWRGAFCKEGVSWIWGCNDETELLSLLRFVKNGKPPLQKSTSKTTKIRKRVKRHEIKAIRDTLRIPFSQVKGTSDLYEVEAGEAREFVAERLRNTYAHSLAKASNRPVYAAAPGTYALFVDKKTQQQLWVSDDTTDVLNVYKEIFECEQDYENWRYLKYAPDAKYL